MRWLRLCFIIPLIFCCHPPDRAKHQIPFNSARVMAEIAVKSDGSIASIVDENRIKQEWATMLIRGTHRSREWMGAMNAKNYIPFNDELFNKYYYRVCLTKTGLDTIQPNGMNFREQSKLLKMQCRDIQKVKIDESNITQVRLDILNSPIGVALKNDVIENTLEWNARAWGRKDIYTFNILKVDLRKSLYDSVSSKEFGTYKVNVDSVKTKFLNKVFLINQQNSIWDTEGDPKLDKRIFKTLNVKEKWLEKVQ